MGGPQVRMVTQGPRPTTITRHAGPVRIQGPIALAPGVGGPRMTNATVSQIRATGATIIQQPGNVQIQSNPPALHPVNQAAFTPGGAQVRIPNSIICINMLLLRRLYLYPSIPSSLNPPFIPHYTYFIINRIPADHYFYVYLFYPLFIIIISNQL